VITSPGGPSAVVSGIIPLADVREWRVTHLNAARKDPARVLPLTDFRSRYTDGLDVSPDTPPLVDWPHLEEVAGSARRYLEDVGVQALSALAGTAVDARDWAVACVRRWR
jgi:hypothetical protein